MPADQLSRVFSSLADRTRRDLVARLASGDATVTALAEPYDVSLQAVSKHLKVLGDAGLVSRTPDGQRRAVHLKDEVFDLTTSRLERYRRQAEERYRRLEGAAVRFANGGIVGHAGSILRRRQHEQIVFELRDRRVQGDLAGWDCLTP